MLEEKEMRREYKLKRESFQRADKFKNNSDDQYSSQETFYTTGVHTSHSIVT